MLQTSKEDEKNFMIKNCLQKFLEVFQQENIFQMLLIKNFLLLEFHCVLQTTLT